MSWQFPVPSPPGQHPSEAAFAVPGVYAAELEGQAFVNPQYHYQPMETTYSHSVGEMMYAGPAIPPPDKYGSSNYYMPQSSFVSPYMPGMPVQLSDHVEQYQPIAGNHYYNSVPGALVEPAFVENASGSSEQAKPAFKSRGRGRGGSDYSRGRGGRKYHYQQHSHYNNAYEYGYHQEDQDNYYYEGYHQKQSYPSRRKAQGNQRNSYQDSRMGNGDGNYKTSDFRSLANTEKKGGNKIQRGHAQENKKDNQSNSDMRSASDIQVASQVFERHQSDRGNQASAMCDDNTQANFKNGSKRDTERNERFKTGEENGKYFSNDGKKKIQEFGGSRMSEKESKSSPRSKNSETNPKVSSRGGKRFERGAPQCGKRKDEPNDESQRGTLTDQLSSNKYECMVCYDFVRVESAVWSCQNCYHVFHLSCIKKWAKSSTSQENKEWRCPGCQNLTDYFPTQYRCFCGRRRDPAYIRGETPHSCGEICRKKRKGNCKHPCTILCHPGPCPPCSAMVTQTCDCGRIKKTFRCSAAVSFKCDQVCGKKLNCSEHKCTLPCHSGSCEDCAVLKEQECFCKKGKRTVFCGTLEFVMESYSCEKVCGKTLSCGNHLCEELCHPGDCSSCSLSPDQMTTCCCGQTSLKELKAAPRTSCLDSVPTCGKICNKLMSCGTASQPHLCDKPCHEGECGPCEKDTLMKCECGAVEKKIPCEVAVTYSADNPFKCQRRCGKKKTCGKHKCSDTCCVKDVHVCEIVCGKLLTCGLHHCEELCHRGNCKRCLQANFEELTCYCGAEVLEPPSPCGTRLPLCHRLCTRQHNCDHPVRHKCHDEETCPQCTELTEKMCMGGHVLRKNVPCHLTNISCGMPCYKPLPCGQHKCQKQCHKGECLTDGAMCTQPCTKLRPQCGHPCNMPCHSGECPDSQCRTEITITCPCGNRSSKAQCLVGGDQAAEISHFQRLSVLSIAESGGENIDMSHFMQHKKNTRRLDCDANCAILERNRRMALALQINNPDVDAKLGRPTFSDFLKEFAMKNPRLAMTVEKNLTDLVQGMKESFHSSKSFSFPAMNRDQRHFVHELAECYGITTQSFDKEPNKNVVATAYKDKSWLPNVTLIQQVAKEQGAETPISSMKTQGVKFTVMGTKKPDPRDMPALPRAWGGAGMVAATKKPGEEPQSQVKNRGWEQKVVAASPKPAPSIDYFDFTE